jgi:hypothetical protein
MRLRVWVFHVHWRPTNPQASSRWLATHQLLKGLAVVMVAAARVEESLDLTLGPGSKVARPLFEERARLCVGGGCG